MKLLYTDKNNKKLALGNVLHVADSLNLIDCNIVDMEQNTSYEFDSAGTLTINDYCSPKPSIESVLTKAESEVLFQALDFCIENTDPVAKGILENLKHKLS